MLKNRKLLATLFILACLITLGLYGNPFPAKSEPAYVHCSVDYGPHAELSGEVAEAVAERFQNLRLSWFPEPKTLNLYFPQPEKQYINLVLGGAAFVHLSLREDGVLYAYLQPWGGRTYKVLNPAELAPLVPLLNDSSGNQLPS